MILYTHNGNPVTDQDFTKALRAIGVVAGDTLFIHSDLTVFGKPEIADPDQFLSSLVQVFFDAVGPEGTVVMPAFTYTFGPETPYDRQHSKSTVGSLTEFFRLQPGVVRSLHPMMSIAAKGPRASQLVAVGKDSFGEGSVFEHLRELDATFVLFGVGIWACTFLHHIEQMHGVPYRYSKSFSGTVIDGENRYEDTCTHYVRPLDGTVENDFSRMDSVVRSGGILREARVGAGTIAAIHAQPLYAAGMAYLDRDSEGLLRI
jgi:aminoglycoside 3-N-acetyltransferase